ncbi:MAG: phosphatidate cytidylyltransferase [Rhodoferax sp.]
MLRWQVNAWWRIFPIFTLAWFTYPWGPWGLVALVAVLACRELAQHHATAPQRFQWACLALLAAELLLMGWGYVEALALLPVWALWQVAQQWRHPSPERLLWLLFVLTCASLGVVLTLDRDWFFYLFVVTALNDVAQFLSGTCLGRHKIAQSISPNKTWAGLAGGVLTSALVSLALGRQLQLGSDQALLLSGVCLSLAGFGGDLLFSAAKRYLGIKDFSNLIPGHGGILDRVDSLVLTTPMLYALLHWAPGW